MGGVLRLRGNDSHNYQSISKDLWRIFCILGHCIRCGDIGGSLSPWRVQPSGEQLVDKKCCYADCCELQGYGFCAMEFV